MCCRHAEGLVRGFEGSWVHMPYTDEPALHALLAFLRRDDMLLTAFEAVQCRILDILARFDKCLYCFFVRDSWSLFSYLVDGESAATVKPRAERRATFLRLCFSADIPGTQTITPLLRLLHGVLNLIERFPALGEAASAPQLLDTIRTPIRVRGIIACSYFIFAVYFCFVHGSCHSFELGTRLS